MIPGLSAEDFCAQILNPMITALGAKAFEHTGTAVLYSGPLRAILTQLSPSAPNTPRSAVQAKRLNATRIDDTEIGKFLTGIDLDDYFMDAYQDRIAAKVASFKVWGHASTEFMKAGFKKVATAVCGADPDRVFRAYELKALLSDENIFVDDVNDLHIQTLRNIFQYHGKSPAGADAVYFAICRAELVGAKRWIAAAPASEKLAAVADYNERRSFYDFERGLAIKPVTKALQAVTAHHAALVDPADTLRPTHGWRLLPDQRQPA